MLYQQHPTKEGGTHLQGFRTGLTKALQKIIPENKNQRAKLFR